MARRQVRFTVRRTIRVQSTVRVQRTVRSQTPTAVASNASLTVPTQPRALPTTPAKRALPRPISHVADLRDEGYGPLPPDDREYDLLLCHASENKDFVGPLAHALSDSGVSVWYDETAIAVGDSLRRSIDKGLARSRFGVVVFSREFFKKGWANYELDGLVAREMQGRKVILPVWHPDMTLEELMEYSPSLADKRALLGSELSVDDIASELAELVLEAEPT